MTCCRIEGQSYDVDALLFDKDGTLLDLNGLWTGWLAALLDYLAAELTPAVELNKTAVQTALGVSEPDLSGVGIIDPRGPLAIGAMDDVMSILAQVLYQQHGIAWNDAVRLVQRARSDADATLDWRALIKPIAGVQDFVAAAHDAGLAMGVVTSDDHENAVHHLECLALSEAFGVAVGHDDVARGKPFTDMIEHACQTLGVAANRTLLFGDSNGDMQMAKAAGMVAGIGLASGGSGVHLNAANQVITDYTGCEVAGTE